MMIIRVAAMQCPLGSGLSLEDKLFLLRRRPDIVCLPEYFFVPAECREAGEAAALASQHLAAIEKLSIGLDATVVGGTMVIRNGEGFTNTCAVLSRGRFLGMQHKINLYGGEPQRGIIPGRETTVFEADGVRFGVLICADALDARLFRDLAPHQVDVVFVPVTSPYRPHDTVFEKHLRDNAIFVRGAQLAKAYVVKTGGVGTVFGHRMQGRSGVFAPWGILAKTGVKNEDRKRVLTTTLDLAEIREFREKMVFEGNEPGS